MIKVLIVEDELLIQRGLLYKVDWLELGCLVVGCASDGNEGLEKIKQFHPDIVVTDVRMPFKDGLEMLSESKDLYGYEAIILSGYSEFDYAKSAIGIGVHDYLLKPIDMDEFEGTLEQLIVKIKNKAESDALEKSSALLTDLLNIQLESQKISNYVLEAIKYIKEHYHHKVVLSEVSDHLDISGVSLNARFKEETEYSFTEFLNRYRIMKAIEMLQNDRLLVYEVAEKIGFSEYKYFSQVFKKHVGMSPKQFVAEK